MPNLTPLVLKDRHSPQVEHTFNPRNTVSGITTLAESTGIPLGDRRITIGQTETAGGRRKVTLKFSMPVVQDLTVNGITKPTVVRTNYADVTFSYDASSSSQERDDLCGFVEQSLKWTDNAMMLDVIVDLQGLW